MLRGISSRAQGFGGPRRGLPARTVAFAGPWSFLGSGRFDQFSDILVSSLRVSFSLRKNSGLRLDIGDPVGRRVKAWHRRDSRFADLAGCRRRTPKQASSVFHSSSCRQRSGKVLCAALRALLSVRFGASPS